MAKLIVIQPGYASRELQLDRDTVSIGRALDNTVALADDANVSRYHAEIEKRGDTFWVIELGSSNGTTVNDEPIDLERQLQDGDLVALGGSTMIEFHLSDGSPARPEERFLGAPTEPAPTVASQAPAINVPGNPPAMAAVEAPDAGTLAQQSLADRQPSTGLSPLLLIAAIGFGLLLTGTVAVFLLSRSWGVCQAKVRITSPQSGTTITGPVPIQVEAEETKCIDRVIYQLDGVKIASSEISPYQAMFDPAEIIGLTPGNHILTVIVEDDKGNRRVQTDEVILGFGNAQVKANGSSENSNSSSGTTTDPRSTEPKVSISSDDIKEMCDRLARDVSRNQYTLDLELIHQIEARTRDYTAEGFYGRARPFRDVINDAFINEQGLEPPLGYITAMSRSDFQLSPQRSSGGSANSEGEGLWRIPLPLAQGAGYLGRCGNSTLADQNQKCAAQVAAAYMKALVVDLFAGDSLYAVACFGMTPTEAAQWRDSLPADRRDLGKVIVSQVQRDRLTRFFAAGIVGENPGKFGLQADSPLSNLYPKK